MERAITVGLTEVGCRTEKFGASDGDGLEAVDCGSHLEEIKLAKLSVRTVGGVSARKLLLWLHWLPQLGFWGLRVLM